MTSDEVGIHNRIDQEQVWQMLIELTLTKEPGNACRVADQVAVAMQPLNWSAAHLERLKLALVKATWNVMEHSRLSGSDMPPIIRVLIPKNDAETQEITQTDHASSQNQPSERVAQKFSRGWGFFLVQKQGNDPQSPAAEAPYMIELFLYQESRRS